MAKKSVTKKKAASKVKRTYALRTENGVDIYSSTSNITPHLVASDYAVYFGNKAPCVDTGLCSEATNEVFKNLVEGELVEITGITLTPIKAK